MNSNNNISALQIYKACAIFLIFCAAVTIIGIAAERLTECGTMPTSPVVKDTTSRVDSVVSHPDTIWRPVTVTTAQPTIKQCRSNKGITASGMALNMSNVLSSRLLGMTRDLRKRYKFGDKIIIKGFSDAYDGVWTFADKTADSVWMRGKKVGGKWISGYWRPLINSLDIFVGIHDQLGKKECAYFCARDLKEK